MPIEYANWDEVWGPPQKRSSKKDPTCSLLKNYDNIVDAYLDEPPRQSEMRPKRPKPLCKEKPTCPDTLDSFYEPLMPKEKQRTAPIIPARQCEFNVQGAGEYDYESSLSFDRYFDENNLFCSTQQSNDQQQNEQDITSTYIPYAEEESNVQWEHSPAIEEETHYNLHQQPSSTSQQYIDLTLYIISGIFIIFMMEQVLQLGIYLGQV